MPSTMKCRICRGIFDDKDHKPHLLPKCGHTFCSMCLRKLFSLSAIFCPYCRTPNAVKSLEELPVNYDIISTDDPSDQEDDDDYIFFNKIKEAVSPNSSLQGNSSSHHTIQTSGTESQISDLRLNPTCGASSNLTMPGTSGIASSHPGAPTVHSLYDQDYWLAKELQEEMDFDIAIHTTFCKDPTHNHDNSTSVSSSWNSPEASDRRPMLDLTQLIKTYTKAVTNPPDETCSICLCELKRKSSYENTAKDYSVSHVISLCACNHKFHEKCLMQLLEAFPSVSMGGSLQCPICKTLHGEKWGNQPPGKMDIMRLGASLPGYSGYGTIQITYNITSGIQGPEHPNPGQRYLPIGFPRIAYLPDTEKGQKVLKLLQEAFRRRLTFTVGTSVTTGCKNAVTWNEIHHKTEWNNFSGHGYPDPNYLDNVLDELKYHGVVDGS